MPIGLCNAPATFQRLMENILAGLARDKCLVYLDDILVIGRSLEEYLSNLREVFERLERAGPEAEADQMQAPETRGRISGARRLSRWHWY